MNGSGRSDRFVVPANPPDQAAAAEAGEERERAKGNTAGETRPGRSAGPGVSSAAVHGGVGVTVVSPTPGRPTARPEPGATRQSLEIYFRLALDGAQKRYRDVVSNFPVSSREISVSIEARLSPFVSRHLEECARRMQLPAGLIQPFTWVALRKQA